MKIKRLLSQILANRKNRLLYIVDAICLTQLSMIYAEKVITYIIEKRADVK